LDHPNEDDYITGESHRGQAYEDPRDDDAEGGGDDSDAATEDALDSDSVGGKAEDMLNSSEATEVNARRRRGGRHLLDLDTYGLSLRHVDQLYTTAFGHAARHVPAHMPHFLDRHVIEEMQAQWPEEFKATSSHRFRSGKDMQYAFSYFYFLMHAPRGRKPQHLLKELDADGDGFFTDNELYTLITRIWPEQTQNLEMIKQHLLGSVEVQLNDGNVVHWTSVAESSTLKAQIEEYLAKEKKYKHETGNSEHVSFHMLKSSVDEVVPELEGIRRKPEKFICLNDNIDEGNETEQVLHEIHALFDGLFPVPSPFELPDGVAGYTYLDQWHEAMWWEFARHRFFVTLSWIVWCIPFMMVIGWLWVQLSQNKWEDHHRHRSPL